VFIFADDLGFNDVGWRGTTNIYTPNMDGLRNNNGIELTRFYVTPKCSPTRASFMTGRYTYKIGMQHSVGIVEHFTCAIEPNIESTYFTERLKLCASYNNHYMGKWHLGEYKWKTTPMYRGGFDSFKGYLNAEVDYFNFTYDTGDDYGILIYDWRKDREADIDTNDTYTTTAFGENALKIINDIGTNNDDTPFTIIVSFESPHSPTHFAPDGLADGADFTSDVIPSSPGTPGPGGPYGNPNNDNYEDRRKYVTMVYAMDYYIGEIVDALKENTVNDERLWDNTWLFFFSDNGGVISYASNYPLRGAKSTNFEGGIRVPSFISGGLLPNKLKGKTYDGLVHVTDFYATVMDYAGVDHDDLYLDGESLRGLLESPGQNIQHSREEFIITADSVDCNATYNDTLVCGGIIKDFGDGVGIFKLAMGSEALTGTKGKFGWGELDNQAKVIEYCNETLGLEPQFTCDPNNLGYTVPTYNAAFKSTDCGPNNEPCFYKLDDDPCETTNIDITQDATYKDQFDELMGKLITAYAEQEPPFWTRTDCNLANPGDVFDFMDATGYWHPFEEWFMTEKQGESNGDQYKAENTDDYLGVCSPTAAPSQAPTAPTAPTDGPTPAPTSIYYLHDKEEDYAKAKGFCADIQETSLATISSQADINDAMALIGDEQVYFGLYDVNDDGSEYGFINGDSCPVNDGSGDCIDFWGNGSPDAGEKCPYFDGSDGMVYNDEQCNTERKFLCSLTSS